MILSDSGLAHLKALESFSATAYWDRTNYAIGYGHNSPKVRKGDRVTKAQAEELLRKDLQHFEGCINKYVQVPLKQHQFDALVSFTYNVGCGAFQRSTLLKRLNAGRYDQVPYQMMLWRKPRSLIKRRKQEIALWKQAPTSGAFLMGNRMKRLAVVIGHNKRSQGAVCQYPPLKGTSEWKYNNEIAGKMVLWGERYGLDVKVFYRDGKLSYSRQVSKTYKATDRWGADATIELHFNGSSSSATRYSTTLVAKGSHQGFRLGQLVQMATVRAFGRTDKQDKGITTRTRADRGGWSLLAGRAPAVLTEPFFGSNAQDCKLAAKESVKDAYARGLLEATAEFLDAQPRQSLMQSRTMLAQVMNAGGTAGNATGGTSLYLKDEPSVIGELGESAQTIASAIDGLAAIAPWIIVVSTLLMIGGIALGTYARIDDFRKGKR